MTRKRDLAKLTGLLSVAAEAGQAVRASDTLPIAALRPGLGQPRREFDQARLLELAASIREQGILQPLLVRPVGDGYEIVAGERRWRAAQMAGLEQVPVLVRALSDREARQVALIENLQREDLNTVDEVDGKLELVASVLGVDVERARGRLMQMLREEPGADHAAVEQLFTTFGEHWQSFTKNKLRILNWPPDVLMAVRAGLPFTLGAVIASAPEAEQARLLALAQGGASRQHLRRELVKLKAPAANGASQVTRVGKALANGSWFEKLPSRDRKAIERWLAKMPDSLRRILEMD